jgi:hypothetical protein
MYVGLLCDMPNISSPFEWDHAVVLLQQRWARGLLEGHCCALGAGGWKGPGQREPVRTPTQCLGPRPEKAPPVEAAVDARVSRVAGLYSNMHACHHASCWLC